MGSSPGAEGAVPVSLSSYPPPLPPNSPGVRFRGRLGSTPSRGTLVQPSRRGASGAPRPGPGGGGPGVGSPGRLLSKLSLGFWVGLCRSPYEQGRPSGPALWPAAIPIAFPFLPRDHRNRPAILQRLDGIRELRNRTFHHEAIGDRNLPHTTMDTPPKLLIIPARWHRSP